MLLKDTKQRLDIPHEDGQWIEIRRLAWRELEEARMAQQQRAMTMMRSMGADVLESLRSAETPAGARERRPDQLYDRGTVLHAGITAWSYDEPVTADNVDALDEATADWAFRQIVGQHEESDETKKKGSSDSTAA